MGRRELWDQVGDDLYRVLGVPRDASTIDIQNAWREAAKRTHPDRGGCVQDFQDAEVAYQVLSDPLERGRYDRAVAAAAAHATAGLQGSYSAPSWTWQTPPATPYGPNPYGSAYAARGAASSPGYATDGLPAKSSIWMVVVFALAIVVGFFVLIVFALAAVVLVIAAAAAGLGAMLRGKRNE